MEGLSPEGYEHSEPYETRSDAATDCLAGRPKAVGLNLAKTTSILAVSPTSRSAAKSDQETLFLASGQEQRRRWMSGGSNCETRIRGYRARLRVRVERLYKP